MLLSKLWAYQSGFFGRDDCLKIRFKESYSMNLNKGKGFGEDMWEQKYEGKKNT